MERTVSSPRPTCRPKATSQPSFGISGLSNEDGLSQFAADKTLASCGKQGVPVTPQEQGINDDLQAHADTENGQPRVCFWRKQEQVVFATAVAAGSWSRVVNLRAKKRNEDAWTTTPNTPCRNHLKHHVFCFRPAVAGLSECVRVLASLLRCSSASSLLDLKITGDFDPIRS